MSLQPIRALWRATRKSLGLTRPAPFYQAACPVLQTTFRFHTRASELTDREVINDVYAQDVYQIGSLTQPPSVVFDFGAHIGSFTVLMKQRFPQAQVFCFEPNKASFALLQANTSGFDGVHLFNKAISYSGRTVLLVSKTAGPAGGPMVGPEEAARYRDAQGAPLPDSEYFVADDAVETMTLEEVFATTGVSAIDYAKWDCEGGEVDAFQNMSTEAAARFATMRGEYHIPRDEFLRVAQAKFPRHEFTILHEYSALAGLFLARRPD